MASLVTPVNGDIVTVSVHKHLITNPALKWSNTYDFKVLDAASGTLFTRMWANTFHFEQTISLNSVHFDEVRISTFAEDSKPYNPEAFMVIPLNDNGIIVATSDPEPLAIAWFIERSVPTGRIGKLFIRGGLLEGDVNSAGGAPTLTTPSDFATRLSAALATSVLDQMFEPAETDSVMVIAHRDKVTHAVTSRPIQTFVSKNAIIAKLSHRRKRKVIAGP